MARQYVKVGITRRQQRAFRIRGTGPRIPGTIKLSLRTFRCKTPRLIPPVSQPVRLVIPNETIRSLRRIVEMRDPSQQAEL